MYTQMLSHRLLTLVTIRELANSGLLQLEINFFKINSNFTCSESFNFKIQELVGSSRHGIEPVILWI